MKISSGQVAGILRDPTQFAGLLLYGEDAGRIRDHVGAATRAVIGQGADPFRSTTLTREEHSRLRDEVASLSLGGGRRVIRVQDAADALATVLDYVAAHRTDALVLLEGGALTPRSKLRMAAEKHPLWAVIACYPDSGAALSGEIKRSLSASGLSIEPSALAYLTQELAGDSNRRRGEIEKLALYAAGSDTITLDVAQACCAVSLDATLGAVVSAALAGQSSRCDALLDELARDGATGPGVLAVLANQVIRLMKVRLLMAGGATAEDACRGMQPPIFPRQMAGLLQEVQRWNVPRLEALGRAIHDADVACKRAASPDLAIAGRLLGMIAGRTPRV